MSKFTDLPRLILITSQQFVYLYPEKMYSFPDMFEALPAGVLIIELEEGEGGRLVYCNDEFEKLFNVSAGEVKVSELATFFDTANCPEEYAILEKAVEKRLSITILIGCKIAVAGSDAVSINVSIAPVLNTLKNVSLTFKKRSGEGESEKASSMLENAAVDTYGSRHDLELTQYIVDHCSVGILWGADGIIRYSNHQFREWTGYAKEELIGQPVSLINPSFSSEDIEVVAKDIMASGSRQFETVHRHKDGHTYPVEVSAKMFEFEGELLIVAFVTSISLKRKAQEQFADMEAQLAHMNRLSSMGEMASAIAHELNQPLNAIKNSAYVVKELCAGDEPNLALLAEMSGELSDQATQASAIVDRVRSFVQRKDLVRTRCDLNQMVRDVKALMDPRAMQESVTIGLKLPATRLFVMGDAIQLKQVIFNLVRNAMDAVNDCPRDRKSVTVQLNECGSGAAEIWVADSGIGVSEMNRASLFEPFFTTKSKGMGVGLSISRSIIQAHGGELTLEDRSKGQSGERFRIVLPMAIVPE